jgi:hypothetical protein
MTFAARGCFIGCLLGAGGAFADDGATRREATVVVPVVSDRGAPVYCTHNRTPTAARPEADGGYRVHGLAPGRYRVRLALTHEHVDVLVAVESGGEVVVPPVVARGRCHSIEVVARAKTIAAPTRTAWALRYGRAYQAAYGVRAVDSSWMPRARK